MQVKALILSHCDDPGNEERKPRERMITVPDAAWEKADLDGKLELAFYYGQNDHSGDLPEHNTTYSLSVGDVVCLDVPESDYSFHLVIGLGFGGIGRDELDRTIAMDTATRTICCTTKERTA